jgi:hypothetical protein
MMSNAKFPVTFFWISVGILLLAYLLPWVINPGAALTMGGYDLAEWISLHPGARNQSPMLLASLLLRLPLVCVTWLISLQPPQFRFTTAWWLRALLAVFLIVAQLPPLEFVTHLNDPNYQQQMALAALSLLGALLGLSGLLFKWQALVMLICVVVGGISSIWGMSQAAGMMHDFRLPAEIGIGVVVYVGVCITWVGVMLMGRNENRTII